jgi:hypothetical protein
MDCQWLDGMAWAYATLNHDAPAMFNAITRAAPVQINDFSPPALSNTSWALGKMKHEASLLFDAIAQAVRQSESTNSARKLFPTHHRHLQI